MLDQAPAALKVFSRASAAFLSLLLTLDLLHWATSCLAASSPFLPLHAVKSPVTAQTGRAASDTLRTASTN